MPFGIADSRSRAPDRHHGDGLIDNMALNAAGARRRPLGVPVLDGPAAHHAWHRLPRQPGGRAVSEHSSVASVHEQLRALVQRYARAADDRDIAALAALFHPDAVIDGARGSQTLEEWLDGMRAPRSFPSSMHMLGDPLIDLDAHRLDTYAVVYQLGDQAAGQADLTLGIRYLDDVVRHDGHWVIQRRVARTLWMR
jgi:hypothetical protein